MFRASVLHSTRLITIALFIMVAGCADLDRNTDRNPRAAGTNTVDLSRSKTPIALQKSLTAMEFFPSATPWNTVISTRTNTPQPTSTHTWTPIPTLQPDKALEALLHLYKDNGGCQLPCWWGITPGKTSWASAHEMLAPMGSTSRYIFNDALYIYTFEFEIPQNMDLLKYLESNLWVKKGSIIAIALNTSWIREDFDFSLSGILEAVGKPEEIWIKVNTDTMALPLYDLDLFYPSQGILINSTGEARAVNDNAVTICPKEFRRGKYPPAILLWDPSQAYSYNEIGSDLLGGSRGIGGENFHLIRELAIDFNEEDFYNTYKDPTTDDCINIDLGKLPP